MVWGVFGGDVGFAVGFEGDLGEWAAAGFCGESGADGG